MKNTKNLEETAKRLTLLGLNLGAFKVKPGKLVLGTPEVDLANQVFLFHPEIRRLVITGFLQILTNLGLNQFDVIASNSTTGISHAYGVAEALDLPLIHVANNRENLSGQRVLLIESFLTTHDASSLNTVNIIRKAGGICGYCLSVFSYKLSDLQKMFFGEILYDGKNKLSEPCNVISLLDYSELLKIVAENNLINLEKEEVLKD